MYMTLKELNLRRIVANTNDKYSYIWHDPNSQPAISIAPPQIHLMFVIRQKVSDWHGLNKVPSYVYFHFFNATQTISNKLTLINSLLLQIDSNCTYRQFSWPFVVLKVLKKVSYFSLWIDKVFYCGGKFLCTIVSLRIPYVTFIIIFNTGKYSKCSSKP